MGAAERPAPSPAAPDPRALRAAPEPRLAAGLGRLGLGLERPLASSGRSRAPHRHLARWLGAAAALVALGGVAWLGAKPNETDANAADTPPAPASPAPPQRPWRIEDARADERFRIVEGSVGRDVFVNAARRAGLTKQQVYALVSAFERVRDLGKTKPGHRFLALLERGTNTLQAFEFVVSSEEVYQARREPVGELVSERLDLQVRKEQVRGAVRFKGGSLAETLEQSGFHAELATSLASALRGHLSLAELRTGDALRVVVEQTNVLGEFSRYGRIESVEVLPAAGDPLRVYFVDGGKTRGYFNAGGRVPDEGGWRKPVAHARVASRFNPRRMHPVLHRRVAHNGTDFAAPTGTPVRAAAPGVVVRVGYEGPSGNLVVVRHPGGYETGYAHLSRFAAGLGPGDAVRRQDLLGYVGSTGRSTGPHLHFSAKRHGRFIDPEALHLDAMRSLNASERALLDAVRATQDPLLDALELPEAPAASPAPPPEESFDDSDGGPSDPSAVGVQGSNLDAPDADADAETASE